MKKIIIYSAVALCSLALVACGQKSSSSQKTKTEDKQVQTSSTKEKKKKSENKAMTTNVFKDWSRVYYSIDVVHSKGLTGVISFGYDGQVTLNRTMDEFTSGRAKGYMKGSYKVEPYKGQQEVATYKYPMREEALSTKSYTQIMVKPQVKMTVTVPQSEIDRIGTTIKDTSFVFYGYKTGDYTILTDGKKDKPTVYIYEPEEERRFQVKADKTAVRKEPLFDADTLEELSKGQTISTVKTVPSQTKGYIERWLEIDSKGQKGYVWQGDLLEVKKSDSSDMAKKAQNAQNESKPQSEEKSTQKVVEATGTPDTDRAIRFQDYSSFAGTWVNAEGNEIVIYPDGSLSNGDHLTIGSPYVDVAVVALKNTGDSVSVLAPGTQGVGGQSDSSKVRLGISRGYPLSTEQYYYRKADGAPHFDKEENQNTASVGSSDINVNEIKQGNMRSLEGSWVQSSRNIWIINDYGGISSPDGKPTSEIIRLASEQDDGPGINLELTYRAVATPLILYPKGVENGHSDSSKNRLTFADTDDYYFYKQ